VAAVASSGTHFAPSSGRSLAYLFARDWNHFLEIQERLLFKVTEIVSRAGSGIAILSQAMSAAVGQQPPPAGSTPAV
jgi:hypothetical protein